MISGRTEPLHDINSSITERSCDSVTVSVENLEQNQKESWVFWLALTFSVSILKYLFTSFPCEAFDLLQ